MPNKLKTTDKIQLMKTEKTSKKMKIPALMTQATSLEAVMTPVVVAAALKTVMKMRSLRPRRKTRKLLRLKRSPAPQMTMMIARVVHLLHHPPPLMMMMIQTVIALSRLERSLIVSLMRMKTKSLLAHLSQRNMHSWLLVEKK